MGQLFNRVRMTVASAAGQGTVSLADAYSIAYCTFAEAGVVNGNNVSYFIEDGNNFEIGTGVYTSVGTTLSRVVVRLSKINGISGTTKLSLTSAAIVYLSPAKEDLNFFGTSGYALIGNGVSTDATYQGFLNPATGATTRTWNAKAADIISIKDFGGIGDNTTDNATPLNNAIAALSGTGGCIFFPPGKYKFNSQITKTLPNSIFSISIIGSGTDNTILTWPSTGGGLSFTYTNTENSIRICDLSLTVGTTNGGNAITLTHTVFPNAVQAQNDIVDITIRGDDGSGAVDYWTNGVSVVGVSNVNFISADLWGPSSPAGNGISVVGVGSNFGFVYNVQQSSFSNFANAIEYGTFTQGLTVNQSNFGGNLVGIHVPAAASNLAQLSVTNSQFQCINFAIKLETTVFQVQISNNLFYETSTLHTTAISMTSTSPFTITGNQFSIVGTPGDGTGVNVVSTAASGGTIVGNVFENLATGIVFGASTNLINVGDNTFLGNTAAITNSGTNHVIHDNGGYNPVGVTAAATIGASPATITAGASPETHYVRQSATNTATIAKGGQQIATLVGATTYHAIELGPNESYVVTWATTAPTYTKDVH